MALPSGSTTSVAPAPFKGQNLEVDFGISDIRQVSAKTIIGYGDSALGKSRNARYFAQWMYEKTGLPARLISEDQEIRDVIAEEASRGTSRKKVDTAAREKQRKTKRDLAKVLASGDERAFLEIMRELGLEDGSPEFAKALKAFREQCGRR